MSTAELIQITKQLEDLKDAGYWAFALLYFMNMATIIMFGRVIHKINISAKVNTEEFSHQKANHLSKSGEYKELIAYTDFYYKIYPYDSHINWYRGYAYYQLGDFANALTLFRKAAEINPGYVEATEPYIERIEQESDGIKNVH